MVQLGKVWYFFKMKRWTTIFKALAHINRLKIIKLLYRGANLTVSQITGELGISLHATSKHLIILQNLDVLDSTGKQGHVFYRLNKSLPRDINKAIKIFAA